MDCGVWIDGLELDLFDSAGGISDSSFFENLFGTSTDSGVRGVDVVVEHRMCFMITIRDSTLSTCGVGGVTQRITS